MIGLMVDLHGTLLDSNYAWIKAFQKFDPQNISYYQQAVWNKTSRKEMAQMAGFPLNHIRKEYCKYLRPRNEIVSFINTLRKTYELVIVSNSKKEDVLYDLNYLPDLGYKAVFSQEDGYKPDEAYLLGILDQLNWDFAYLIGNDEYEDFLNTKRICSVLVPYHSITFSREE